jgi:hypothetical protein
MTQPVKILGAAMALITAALVGGTLIGSVLAAPFWSASTGSDASSGTTDADLELSLLGEDGEVGEYCQVFLDTFASELGVSADDLAPAAKAAAIAAVEAAVEAGDLTEAQGEAAIERINAWDGTGCTWIGFHLRHWAGHGARVEFMQGMFEAAATELGMTTAELREALADATLEEVAEAEGVPYADVVAAALASAEEDLDAAVEAGTITQEQADSILERLETWLNDGGPGSWGDRPGPGRHFRFFFGPPADTDSSNGSDSSDAEGTAA